MSHLGEVDRRLGHRVANGEIPGIVAMAARGNEIVYEGAFGKRGLAIDHAMTADTVFWIASMTKAITATAAMQLVERGRLSLDEPIGKVLPEFASPKVLEGFDERGEPILRPANSPVTLRRLLTHTAGFCYDTWNADMARYMRHTGLPSILSGKLASLSAPLVSDPGTRWEYGIGIDVAGRAVEVASGQDLETYLRKNLFEPLGMADSGFYLSENRRQRLAGMHARKPDGSLAAIPFEVEQKPEFAMGGGGLYSTAGDYIKFMQMILNKGRSNGPQLLKPETIALMGQNHIGELTTTKMKAAAASKSNDVDFFPGIIKKWGLSFLINTSQTREGRSAGGLAWAGLSNCYQWIDPVRDISGVILMQLFPFADQKCLDAFADLERGIYAALDTEKAG